MRATTFWGIALLTAAALFVILVPDWEKTPASAVQMGLPQSIQFGPSRADLARNQPPAPLPPAPDGGPKATETYKNVTVLTDVSAAEFMRLQHAITDWVAPKQGCGFCHEGSDYASDANPHKLAARMMLRMTRHLNIDWATHVMPSGVTCYTCHRGQPAPPEIWFPREGPPVRPMVAKQEDWYEAADTVRKFFPVAGWSEYFLQDEPISVQSTDALPNGTISQQRPAKRIYEMMMQMSDGLGVNCGYCHNSRAFESWSESTPKRWVAYDAIHLVRDLNRNFLLAVGKLVPQTRVLVGETALPVLPARESGRERGDGLVVCATCHTGLTKPLGGAAMLPDYPGLGAVAASAAVAP